MKAAAKYSDYTDEQLLHLLKENNKEGIQVIYDRYWLPLLRYIYSFTRNQEEAQDILQDIFLKLVRKKYLNGIQFQLKAYLYTVARRESIKYLQKKFPTQQLDDSFDEYLASTHAQHGAHQLLVKELRSKYEYELTNLPPRLKEVFELSRNHGLSSKEISVKLGLSDQTVRNQISEVLHILRRKLQYFLFFIFF